VLLVGMGMPRQEMWIESNLNSLNISLAMPVGALFQYYSGAKRRAPRWMTAHGLEWLGRLVQDPRQTFHRYVVGNPQLVARVFRERLNRGRS
jgi:N-acetylglucosaminyldiphosphoundecaprenol N-acetyl-beta-D-mannosaminyltransferase